MNRKNLNSDMLVRRLKSCVTGQRLGGLAGVGSKLAIGADGTVYFGSADGRVHAYQGSSGLAESPWPKFRGDARNTGRISLPAPLSLRVSRQGEKVRIEWSLPGILQSTAELAPASWQDVDGASAPYGVEPADGQRFYRLRRPRRVRPGQTGARRQADGWEVDS